MEIGVCHARWIRRKNFCEELQSFLTQGGRLNDSCAAKTSLICSPILIVGCSASDALEKSAQCARREFVGVFEVRPQQVLPFEHNATL